MDGDDNHVHRWVECHPKLQSSSTLPLQRRSNGRSHHFRANRDPERNPAPRLRELHSIGLLDISASNHRLCPLADVPQATETAASAGSLKDVVIQPRSSTFQENKSMLSKQAPIDSGFGPQRIAIETLGGAGLGGKVAIVTGGA